MKIHTFGSAKNPTLLLLHGGGLSHWAWQAVAAELAPQYYILAPVLPGHGENAAQPFKSIAHCAQELLDFIDTNCGGKVFCLGGLSIGAQIATEMLAQRPHVARYAVLESALVLPLAGVERWAPFTYSLCYPLVRQRWFAKLQANSLGLPKNLWDCYYADTVQMTKASLIAMTLSNGTYALPQTLCNTTADVLVIAGSKELRMMQASAKMLHKAIPGSRLHIAEGMGHGELSLQHANAYAALLRTLFTQ